MKADRIATLERELADLRRRLAEKCACRFSEDDSVLSMCDWHKDALAEAERESLERAAKVCETARITVTMDTVEGIGRKFANAIRAPMKEADRG
jgi:hypothetical protein